ncbi:MAG: hypothetical protein JXR76_00780 [Deltaproteobacteria bacterium]|nr:hypothetical protein [Deltaproteobacteria bacterium]
MGGLSSLLVQDQVLSVTQIEQTLQRQVILGGDLPTILLELRMLDEHVLVDYMGKVVGLPVLTAEFYQAIDPALCELVSKETATECRAVPVQKRGDGLIIAVTGTLAPKHISKLSEEAGTAIIPQLVLEFRLALLMNQVYGVALSGRMSTLQKKLLPDFKSVQFSSDKLPFNRPAAEPVSAAALEDEVDEKISIEATTDRSAEATTRFYQAGQPLRDLLTEEKKVSAAFKSPPRQSPPRMDDIAARVRLTAPPESEMDDDDLHTKEQESASNAPEERKPRISIPAETVLDSSVSLKRQSLKRKLISFSEAAAMLDEAENRDQIMETFFHFSHQAFDFTFLAVVHGEDAAGRMAAYRGGEFNDAEFVSIPLSEDGLFAKAVKSLNFQIGAMDDQMGLNALNQLGLDVPLNAAVIPVVLKRRVILLLYGDSGHHGIRAKRVERIFEFSRLVASAFERLLIARKLRKFSSVPPPPMEGGGDETSDDAQEAIKVKEEQVARPRRDLSAFLNDGGERRISGTHFSDGADAMAQIAEVASDLESALALTQRMRDTRPVAVAKSDEHQHVARRTLSRDDGNTITLKAPAAVAPATVSAADKQNQKQSSAPSADSHDIESLVDVPGSSTIIAHSAREHDTTVRIHVERRAQRTEVDASELAPIEHHPSVKVVTPIRVSRLPKSAAPDTDTDENRGPHSEAPFEKAASSPVKVDDLRGTVPFNVQIKSSAPATMGPHQGPTPQYVPRSTLADGLYMQVDKEYQRADKRAKKITANQFPIPEELLEKTPAKNAGLGEDAVDEKRGANAASENLAAARRTAEFIDTKKEGDFARQTLGRVVLEPMVVKDGSVDAKDVDVQRDEVSEADLDAWVMKLISGDYSDDIPKKLLDAGDVAIQALIAHFPGPLSCDRFQEMGNLSDISHHGPVLRVLKMFGEQTVPFVIPLLDSFDSEIRFYSTFLFFELKSLDVLNVLVNRAFDNDRQIRALAIDSIMAHAGAGEYLSAVEHISMVLVGAGTTLEKKRIAAEALGQIKEPESIPALSAMLGSVDGILAERCQKALVSITFRDFGFSEKRWNSWYNQNRTVHRLEWAIDAINDKHEEIQRMALSTLKKSVGDRIEWPRPPYDFTQRRLLEKQLRAWWINEGKALFLEPVS